MSGIWELRRQSSMYVVKRKVGLCVIPKYEDLAKHGFVFSLVLPGVLCALCGEESYLYMNENIN